MALSYGTRSMAPSYAGNTMRPYASATPTAPLSNVPITNTYKAGAPGPAAQAFAASRGTTYSTAPLPTTSVMAPLATPQPTAPMTTIPLKAPMQPTKRNTTGPANTSVSFNSPMPAPKPITTSQVAPTSMQSSGAPLKASRVPIPFVANAPERRPWHEFAAMVPPVPASASEDFQPEIEEPESSGEEGGDTEEADVPEDPDVVPTADADTEMPTVPVVPTADTDTAMPTEPVAPIGDTDAATPSDPSSPDLEELQKQVDELRGRAENAEAALKKQVDELRERAEKAEAALRATAKAPPPGR